MTLFLLLQVLDGVIRFVFGESLCRRDELVMNSARGHAHLLLVGLCFCKSICVPVRFEVVDCVLGGFAGELLGRRGELVENALLGHVHRVGIAFGFRERRGVFLGHAVVC